MPFILKSEYRPTGDQPQAIEALSGAILEGKTDTTLLGVTGSGKTYTVANVIEKVQMPTLVIAHNKTLAAQLYQEFRDFFPENAVSYFVSYYDYYQPEAYIPQTDTYIEKETQINDEIDKLRLSSTAHLLTRPDVIVVASVSSIYNLGSPVEYGQYILELIEGQHIDPTTIYERLLHLQYQRSQTDLARGMFRVKGETVQLWPAYKDFALRLEFRDNVLIKIVPIDPVSGMKLTESQLREYQLPVVADRAFRFVVYPAKHYQTNPATKHEAIKAIRADLAARLTQFKDQGKVVEAFRLEQKVTYDLEMIEEFGFVNGIENYSRYFDGRQPGQAPYSLLDYFQHNATLFGSNGYLTVIDESHITLPQIRGMYAGDRSRKQTLIDFGFRLPSALDNRPLTFDEFLARTPRLLYVSATPDAWELGRSQENVVEQLVRPTGLLDPSIEIRSSQDQIPDLLTEIMARVSKGQRVLVTTLTKRMAEDLTEFLSQPDKLSEILGYLPDILPKVAYLHADVETLKRSQILDELRQGVYDVLIGINLLREGLDLPEVSLVAILDADKEGFLRSRTSLIQTMGRAARHVEGTVILYADTVTKSMQQAIDEGVRRRQIQEQYNRTHKIVPMGISKPIRSQLITKDESNTPSDPDSFESIDLESLTVGDRRALKTVWQRKMNQAAKQLEFEEAARIRDWLEKL